MLPRPQYNQAKLHFPFKIFNKASSLWYQGSYPDICVPQKCDYEFE